MTPKERIKEIQKLVGANRDGVIGRETLTKFAATFGRPRVQVIHFFANIHHESGGFSIARENMNYSAGRIMDIFGIGKHSAKVTAAESQALAGKPYDLAERVYGLGNPTKAKELGNLKVGDGWKYRGGGAIQITGGDAFTRFGGQELYLNPDLVGTSAYYFTTALNYFNERKVWALAKDLTEESIRAVCRRINGGLNGIDDRRAKVRYYDSIWK
ncbi:glycoside hydrolase family 19 protein [Sphingobacterium griseoflavum]|uniref:Endolysin n=1 Tax=Sphingobacterium griseoflavum TaxID=1474952 RepID=A0ABQ3HX76_9SPHI|nr:glycoside hydrolase family 19 protein [Sphingobacterium griseoflavum]GHE34963.1 endolysin [Sphingobacterium griseoflavum]